MNIYKTVRTALPALRILLPALVLALNLIASTHAYAAPVSPEQSEVVLAVAGETLGAKLEEFATDLSLVGRPLSLLALVIVFLFWIAEPLMPDAARDNKGKIQKVAFGAILLGIVPDLVSFLFD